MKDLNTVIDHAEQQCQQRGTKLTAKRKLILTGLLKSNCALSAYELVDVCRDESGESMPVMSVYRILKFLECSNLVHRLKLANRYVACVHISCSHQHAISQFLICVQCKRVEEISLSRSTLTTIRRKVTEVGYKLVNPQLEIDCLCESCDS